MTITDISKPMEDTLKDNDLQNLTSGLAEVGLDAFLDGIAKDIPVFNSILGIGKGYLAIKDRLFLKKLIYFLSGLKNTTPDERREMINKIDESGKYRTRVGEKLIYIIDSCDDHEKAEIISKLFEAFLLEKINYDSFQLASNVVIKITLMEFKFFLKTDFEDDENQNLLPISNLFSSVLFTSFIDVQNENKKTYLHRRISSIGKKVKQIFQDEI